MNFTSKKNLISSGIAVLLLAFIFSFVNQAKKRAPMPVNTIVVHEDELHEKRQAWIEQMHATAPGVNWRKMDMEYRLVRSNNFESGKERENVLYGKWEEVGSNNQAGRTLVAEYDSITNTVFVAADGGQIWKGTIGSEDWVSINDNLKIPSIHFIRNLHNQNSDRLLVGSGMWNDIGILYSDDAGLTWEQATGLQDIQSWGYIRRTVMKEDVQEGVYVLAQQWDYDNWHAMSVIYVSHDEGESFEPLANFPYDVANVDIWTSRYNNNELFVLNKNVIYTLDDSGNLTYVGEIEATEPDNVYLTGAFINGINSLYAMQRRSNSSEFYASTDEGANWTYKSNLDFGPFMINSFKASPFTAGLLYYGGVNAYSSSDFGQTWDLVNEWYEYYDHPENKLHADIPSFDSFLSEDGQEFLFINTDGGLFVSYDNLSSVTNLSLNNLRISQYYSSYTCRFAPENTHAGSQDQGYQFANEANTNEPLNYEQVISGDYGSIVSGDQGASVWMVYPTFAMYNSNANNGGSLHFWDFIGENYQWLPNLMEDPDDPASVFIAGGRISSGAHIIHLSYQSGQMSYVEEPYDFSNGTNATISALAYSPIDPDYRYVFTTERDFFYSSDGGVTWTQSQGFEGPESHYFYGASIQPSNNTIGLVYIAGSGYSGPAVFKSTDHGATFNEYDTGLPETLVFDLALSPDDSLLFAATEVGAFVCKTWDSNWYDLGDSILPDQSYWAVDYVPALECARFASYGRGIWEFNRSPVVESAFEADTTIIAEGGTVNFTDLSHWNPTQWSWTFEGGEPSISTEQNPTVNYPTAGVYDVTLIAYNNSGSDTLTKTAYIEVKEITALKDISASEITIFPNPASDQIRIKSESAIQKIEIWDYQGRLVMKIHDNQGSRERIININKLPVGSYLLKLKTNNGLKIKRLIKE